MAHWDGRKIVYWPPRPVEGYSGWEWHDHGCCNGIKWGGDYPVECRCNSGAVAIHVQSGIRALYPGGPFI